MNGIKRVFLGFLTIALITGLISTQQNSENKIVVPGPLSLNEEGEFAPLDGPLSSEISSGKIEVPAIASFGKKRLIDLPNSKGELRGPMREMQAPKPQQTGGSSAVTPIQTIKGTANVASISGSGFDGMNLSNNGGGWPPDTVGDIGPSDYVQAVNTSVGIFPLSNSLLGTPSPAPPRLQNFNSFMVAAGQSSTSACGSQNQGDPIVLYDTTEQKWLVMDFAFPYPKYTPSYFCIAISNSSSATGTWKSFQILASSTDLADYPKVASTPNGIVITANMFKSGRSYSGAKAWLLKRDDLFGTGASLKFASWTLGNSYFSLMPANVKFPVSGQLSTRVGGYLFSDYGLSGQMRIFQIPKLTWSETTLPAITTKTFTVDTYATRSTKIPQKGSTEALDVLGDRLMYAAQLADVDGTGTNAKIYVSRTVNDSLNYAGIRWYELQVSGATNSSSVTQLQAGTYSPSDATHRWMPSIAVNKTGVVGIGFSTSKPTDSFPGIGFAARCSTAPTSTLNVAEIPLVAGTGAQNGGYNRWGDYSMLSVHPAGDVFWMTSEYYSATSNNWQTRIIPVKVTCP